MYQAGKVAYLRCFDRAAHALSLRVYATVSALQIRIRVGSSLLTAAAAAATFKNAPPVGPIDAAAGLDAGEKKNRLSTTTMRSA